jgi:hypothetical protein
LKGLSPLFGHEPSHNIIQHSQDAAAQKPICCIRAPPWQAGPSLLFLVFSTRRPGGNDGAPILGA